MALFTLFVFASPAIAPAAEPFHLDWRDDRLTISRADLPGRSLEIWYLEAYCRPGSTDRDWCETVIPHRTTLLHRARHELKLRCRLDDGVQVDHHITAAPDHVDFRLTAHNPTDQTSLAHWAQPCIRVDRFTGRSQEDYLPKCFVFLDGQLHRLPTDAGWATQARYTPGQVWAPAGVDRDDVNPRPLSPLNPSNGLIGCYSADESWILATAWEPYQELFQGVIVCIHSDFRIGGLEPGQSKQVRGRLYLTHDPLDDLLDRYRADFPEHHSPAAPPDK